ncbi:hypothetical protein GOAMR_40_00200 [Gordonia amarae NBRC 15530]|uniref:Uncharacterized protein n=1 Tax=Gordonia amarae NBRC 15530 TaxID=1075090 RepID=G7GPK5_9ACTN|nr:hypothetical protein [Gordonia amarae]QHN18012.1 hypothetical protein GII35_14500 [Gordonia amarae]QHN22532.1 hypothetical protein GII34_14240 [Gordonia amarae]GAB05530.1 hypothetical protein GOAMR_40_00200 [Gordonia amarae NBRC 15530]
MGETVVKSARAWRRVAPWLLPALVLVEAMLVLTGRIGLGVAVWIILAVESLLLVAAVIRIVAAVRRFNNGRAEGADRWRAAEDGLGEMIPRKAVKAILIEPRMLACIGAWIRSFGKPRPDNVESFRYGAQLRTFVGVLVVVVLVEGALIDLILAAVIPGSAWIWVVLGLHVYGAMWLMGLLASMYTRPHLLTDTGLVVRDSVFNELSVPYDAILGVAQVDHPNSGRSGLKLSPADRTAVMAYGIANVEISLRESVSIKDLGHVPVRRLRISVDDPAGLVRAIDERSRLYPFVIHSSCD